MVRETSIEAYNEIKSSGVLSARRWEIYDCLFRHGPLTANEIFRRIMGRSGINQANVPARLNELVKMGAVKETGKRDCSVTNVVVLEFDVTSKIPSVLEKKLTKKQKVESIVKDLREFCRKNNITGPVSQELVPIVRKIREI